MGDDAVFAAQQRRVTEQLGAAMLAAVGLMVRQYLGAPTGENEGQDSAAAPESGAGRHDAAEAFVSAEGGDALRTARSVSGEIERDARRYDGGFYLY